MGVRFKVGDRVQIKSLDWYNENKDENGNVHCGDKVFDNYMSVFCGSVVTIGGVYPYIAYDIREDMHCRAWTDEMIEGLVEEEVFIKANDIYNEEYSKGEYCHEQSFKWGFQEGYNYSHENDKLEISLKEGYIFKDENGNVINATKIVLEKKGKEYPNTYEECCKVLGWNHRDYDRVGYKSDLLCKLQVLLLCRDAYWKIAGEEMGLGKTWEPDWSDYENIKYIIGGYDGEIGYDQNHHIHKILAFPTEEMRDAFYENFKGLIEQCKELL